VYPSRFQAGKPRAMISYLSFCFTSALSQLKIRVGLRRNPRKTVTNPISCTLTGLDGATHSLVPRKGGWPPTPLTNLVGSCLELFSGKGLESALLEEIGLKHGTVSCHHGAVFPKTPMDTRTVPWLHSVRLPPREQLRSVQNGKQSVPSRSLVRCVSLSPLKSGNKPDKPQASTDVVGPLGSGPLGVRRCY